MPLQIFPVPSFPSFSYYSCCDQRASPVRARWRQQTYPAAVGEKKEEEERFTLLDGDLRGSVHFYLAAGLWTGVRVSKSAQGLLMLLRFSVELMVFRSLGCCVLLQPSKRHFVRRSWHGATVKSCVCVSPPLSLHVVLGDAAFARRLSSTSNLTRNFTVCTELWNPPVSFSVLFLSHFLCKTLLILLKISVLSLKKTILATFNHSRLGSARFLCVKVRFVLNRD